MITVSAVVPRNNNRNVLQSLRAAERPTSTSVQAASNASQDQLRQLLLERKQLPDEIVDTITRSLEYGRGRMSEYTQAKQAALLAGIDLCNTQGERIDILKELVQLFTEGERSIQREAALGQAGREQVNRARLARLESEIDLLKEQLNSWQCRRAITETANHSRSCHRDPIGDCPALYRTSRK